MSSLSAPLVGMRWHPPALTIVQGLGMDEPLIIKREPENQFDENAIQVFLPEGWPKDNLELANTAAEEATAQGLEAIAEAISYGAPIFLGYIRAVEAKDWARVMDEGGETSLEAKLTFSSTGSPQVTIEVEAGGDEAEPELSPYDEPEEGNF